MSLSHHPGSRCRNTRTQGYFSNVSSVVLASNLQREKVQQSFPSFSCVHSRLRVQYELYPQHGEFMHITSEMWTHNLAVVAPDAAVLL